MAHEKTETASKEAGDRLSSLITQFKHGGVGTTVYRNAILEYLGGLGSHAGILEQYGAGAVTEVMVRAGIDPHDTKARDLAESLLRYDRETLQELPPSSTDDILLKMLRVTERAAILDAVRDVVRSEQQTEGIQATQADMAGEKTGEQWKERWGQKESPHERAERIASLRGGLPSSRSITDERIEDMDDRFRDESNDPETQEWRNGLTFEEGLLVSEWDDRFYGGYSSLMEKAAGAQIPKTAHTEAIMNELVTDGRSFFAEITFSDSGETMTVQTPDEFIKFVEREVYSGGINIIQTMDIKGYGVQENSVIQKSLGEIINNEFSLDGDPPDQTNPEDRTPMTPPGADGQPSVEEALRHLTERIYGSASPAEKKLLEKTDFSRLGNNGLKWLQNADIPKLKEDLLKQADESDYFAPENKSARIHDLYATVSKALDPEAVIPVIPEGLTDGERAALEEVYANAYKEAYAQSLEFDTELGITDGPEKERAAGQVGDAAGKRALNRAMDEIIERALTAGTGQPDRAPEAEQEPVPEAGRISYEKVMAERAAARARRKEEKNRPGDPRPEPADPGAVPAGTAADGPKYPFTSEQMKQIFSTNILDFAAGMGLKTRNADRNTVHVEGSGGLYLWKHGRGYYRFSDGRGGNIVDFVQEYYHLDKTAAMEKILGCRAYERTAENRGTSPEVREAPPAKEFTPPQKDTTQKHMMAYLTRTRGIDPKIIQYCLDEKTLYQSAHTDGNRTFRHAAFIGKDAGGTPRHAFLRSTLGDSKFRADAPGSDKHHCFAIPGKNTTVYLFESPVDLLSHATMIKRNGRDWRESHLLSCNGVSTDAVHGYLMKHPDIDTIKVCFDGDGAGRTGATRVSKEFGASHTVRLLEPAEGCKDINEMLLRTLRQERENAMENPFEAFGPAADAPEM